MSNADEGAPVTQGHAGDRIDRRGFIRRGSQVVAGTSFAAMALSACGGSSSGSKTSGGGGGTKRIAIGAPQDPSLTSVKEKLIPQFTKETGIEVQYLETDYGSLLQKLIRDAQNNTGVYDLGIINDVWIAQLAGPGLITDLDSLGVKVDDDIFPALTQDGHFPRDKQPVPPVAKGKDPALYSLAIIADVASFVYRTDHFDAPPTTWDEVLAVADEKADPGKKLYSYVYPGSRSNGDPGWWIPILATYGGDLFNDKWEPIFNSEAGVKALDTLMKLSRQAPPGVAQFGFDQLSQTLNNGQVLSAIVYAGWAKDVFNPETSKVADKMGSMVPPTGTASSSLIGPFMTAIPKTAKNPEGAAEFLNWMTSERIQRQFAEEYGGTSIRRSVMEDPKLQERYPYFKGINESLSVAKYFPPTDQFFAVYDPLSIQLNKAYSEKGRSGSSTYLDAAAASVHDVLERAGYYA